MEETERERESKRKREERKTNAGSAQGQRVRFVSLQPKYNISDEMKFVLRTGCDAIFSVFAVPAR